MIGLMRVLSTTSEDVLESHSRALAGIIRDRIETRAIPDQPRGIHSPQTLAQAIPKLVQLGREFAADGATSLIVSCAADPALAELREALTIPVVGAGSAGASLARATSDRVGVLGITAEVPDCITHVLGTALVADLVPDGVHNTTDLMTPEGAAAVIQGAHDLVAAGADCILFACTGLTTIGAATAVAEATGKPVIDAVVAAGHLAAYPWPRPATR